MEYLKSFVYWIWTSVMVYWYTGFTIDCIKKIGEATGWAVVGWFFAMLVCIALVLGVGSMFIFNITIGISRRGD